MLGEHAELAFAIASGVLLFTGRLVARFSQAPDWVPIALYVGAYLAGGDFTLRVARSNLWNRRFEIDMLMLVAAAGAAVLGQLAEGALLLFLFCIGHSLEHYAMGWARRVIAALAKLAAATVTVRREGRTEEVPLQSLHVGDVIPVDKEPADDPAAALDRFDELEAEHRVFAGTVNGSGTLEVVVARLAQDTTLARVAWLPSCRSGNPRSPTQLLTDRFERRFVPIVLGVVGPLPFARTILDEPASASFYHAMAVLVAASPCALAISVPSASCRRLLGRRGVASSSRAAASLRTSVASRRSHSTRRGTLTEGRPRPTRVAAVQRASEQELLRVAIAVEAMSDPATFVCDSQLRLGEDVQKPRASNVTGLAGRGVSALKPSVSNQAPAKWGFRVAPRNRISAPVWQSLKESSHNGSELQLH